MNFSLFDKIESVDQGFVAIILRTEGHTYKKRGAKALFRQGHPFPIHGNLGALCADQLIVEAGGRACRDDLPRIVSIDTTSPDDADLGHGTYCGGLMEVLIEPLRAEHKAVYRQARERLERGGSVTLVHDTTSGVLAIAREEGAETANQYVETLAPPRRLYLFGATPLAERIVRILGDSDFDVHVVDWRSAYLDALEGVDAARRHLDEAPFDATSYVVILSHSYRRDKEALERALAAGAPFVGMMSSRTRRDRMFDELRREGVGARDLDRVRSPVGIDTGGSTETDIAIGIVAEIVRFANQ